MRRTPRAETGLQFPESLTPTALFLKKKGTSRDSTKPHLSCFRSSWRVNLIRAALFLPIAASALANAALPSNPIDPTRSLDSVDSKDATDAVLPLDQAQRQVLSYLSRLADLRCTESVDQEKLTGNGHVEVAAHSKYDYFLLMQGNGDDLQLSESRLEISNSAQKPLPLLLTNGFSTLLLVFHPYYRNSFQFEPGALENIDGRTLRPVHFTHITGTRAPAALALRGREYPLELTGTAWLDEHSGQVILIEASLLHEMSDVGLRSLQVHVEYKSVQIAKTSETLTLPSRAVIELRTPRQHWRNTHLFNDYKSFSADAEQDPNVKIHKEAKSDEDTPKPSDTANPKEKP